MEIGRRGQELQAKAKGYKSIDLNRPEQIKILDLFLSEPLVLFSA